MMSGIAEKLDSGRKINGKWFQGLAADERILGGGFATLEPW